MSARLHRVHPAWIAAGVTFLTLMASAGFRSAPSILIVPLEEAFGWSRADISLAVGVNVLLYGLVSPFAAALMERFGIRRVVMAALSLVALGSGCTVFVHAPWQLVILWGFVVGIGTGSMALVFAATVASRWFVARRGLVTGFLTAAAATGQLVFLPGLAHACVTWGWQSVSLIVAACALAAVPLVFLFLGESPARRGLKPYGAGEEWTPPAPSAVNPARLAMDSLRKAVRVPSFWYLALSFFVCGLSTSGLMGTHFIPAAHDHGMSEPIAAGLLALIGVFDVIGTLASGWLTDRIDSRKLLFAYYGLRGLSLLILPSILFSSVHPSTLVFVIFYGLDWVATVPPTIHLCREVLGPERGTVVYGWVFAAHQIGGAVAAYGAGLLRVHFGDYALAFYIGAVMCLVASVLVLKVGPGRRAVSASQAQLEPSGP